MKKQEAIEAAWNNSMSYEEYISLIEKLHEEKKATSFPENEEYFQHSVMGLRRMQRIFKKMEFETDLVKAVSSLKEEQRWILITESWCGDASQTVPIIAKLATLSDKIDLRIVLRDSNPEYMGHYLTNGGKSIPILVVYNINMEEMAKWGPRPAAAQQILLDYKAMPEPKPPYENLSLDLQKWYNRDKGKSTENELMSLMKNILID